MIILISFQRPRKIGAKFTGDDIAPDEHLQPNLSFDYDVKRDRWNGYNVDDHQELLEDHFSRIEEVCFVILKTVGCFHFYLSTSFQFFYIYIGYSY